ncbi:universal stress protein [Brachybacterium huguangmaarense]|uniref:Universal stress protein n=1 Tax=Brachybacterium huguangmaarense TaxID=1652028 RepID=A0ABY6G4N0_9MICO|nr:universal stress protein [Brachybacterium huguangmaarense]UYG17608.1 universal stress protein [Brachybacterium huguangmaarense]
MPPQPAVDRITPFAGHPIVVGVVPELPDLVTLTAASIAQATGARAMYFAYSDPSRTVREERPDGSVVHEPIDPDGLDDRWELVAQQIVDHLTHVLSTTQAPWEFRYLAGRPDRALTHLARAVDAAAIVVGTRTPRRDMGLRQLFEGSVAVHLSQHQHRPVITVPLSVVDWKETASAWDRREHA